MGQADEYLTRLWARFEEEREQPAIEVPVGATDVLSEEASEIADIRQIVASYRIQGWGRPAAGAGDPAPSDFDAIAVPGGAEVLMPREPDDRRDRIRYTVLGVLAAAVLVLLCTALASAMASSPTARAPSAELQTR